MKVDISYRFLRRSFLYRLVAVVSLLACHLAMTGEKTDSLYSIYLNADKGKKIEMVNNLSHSLFEREITDTLYTCSPSTKSEELDAMMHYLMSEDYYDKELFEEALQKGKKAKELTDKRKADKFRSDVLGLLSNAQYRSGDYDEALKTLLLAYQVDKELNNQRLISSDLNSLAAIYLAVGQPEPGIQFIEKAIAMEREMNRQDRLATRLGIASELYLINNDDEKAMKAIEEAYQIDYSSGRMKKAAVRLVQKGAILAHLSHYDEARTVIMQALPELEKAGNSYSLAVGYNQLGAIEQKLGNIEASASWYNKALSQSVLCGAPKVERTAERGLWETLRKNNPNVALIHLERYTTLSDSMENEMSAMQMQVLKTTIINNELKEVNKKSRLFSQLLKWGGLTLIVMLTAMIGGLFFSWRRGQKTLNMQRQTQEARSHFFTNITNELQTPLTVVLGAGQELLTGGKTNAENNRLLGELIVKHGKNMLGLVNQLLDIEKARSGTLPEMRHGDIVMFVRLLVDNFTVRAQQQFINLSFSSPVNTLSVNFSPDYIRKIVHGLIANALAFTPRNGSVKVTLTPPENGWMRLSVSDTGKGIPKDEKKRLFEPLSQSPDNDDNGPEVSADLSLVNQLVIALKGTITVDSEEGRGTTFIINLPVETGKSQGQAETATAVSLAEERINSTRKRRHHQRPLVFIVEDNEEVAYFVANHLKENYELRFAHDGREALNNALELVPALIITSLRMPVMGGKDFIKRVRANNTLSHIPIIAMTSDTSEQERLSCIEVGADAVLVKPFNSLELELTTKHLIDQSVRLRERLSKTINESKITSISKEDKEFINRLVEVIHAQLALEDIDMNHIAAAMSMTPKQLRTSVMSITGLTPVAYILQVRLNYARHIISSEDTSLTQIAAKCGFQNLSHFSKAFKQQFGVSPTQFRKNLDNINPPVPLSP